MASVYGMWTDSSESEFLIRACMSVSRGLLLSLARGAMGLIAFVAEITANPISLETTFATYRKAEGKYKFGNEKSTRYTRYSGKAQALCCIVRSSNVHYSSMIVRDRASCPLYIDSLCRYGILC